MTTTQLSFFDAPAAREYRRKQDEIEQDAMLVKILGPKGAKKWHDNNNRLLAKLDEICSQPHSSDMEEIIAKMRAKVLASTQPLADNFALLGIESRATKREIYNAYRRKARKLHPDVGGDEASFKQLHATYRQLLAMAKE